MLIETWDLLDCRQSGRVSPLTVVGRVWPDTASIRMRSTTAQPLQRLIAFVNSHSKIPTRPAALCYVAFLTSSLDRFVRMALAIT